MADETPEKNSDHYDELNQAIGKIQDAAKKNREGKASEPEQPKEGAEPPKEGPGKATPKEGSGQPAETPKEEAPPVGKEEPKAEPEGKAEKEPGPTIAEAEKTKASLFDDKKFDGLKDLKEKELTPSSEVVKTEGATRTDPALAEGESNIVAPQRNEPDERMLNLILEQIKELISIDDDLNKKIKEINDKITKEATGAHETKRKVEGFDERISLIEKNMQRFMALYEVVTDQFNPFSASSDEDSPGVPRMEERLEKEGLGPAVKEDDIMASFMTRPPPQMPPPQPPPQPWGYPPQYPYPQQQGISQESLMWLYKQLREDNRRFLQQMTGRRPTLPRQKAASAPPDETSAKLAKVKSALTQAGVYEGLPVSTKARDLIRNVPEDQVFRTADGKVARNLLELLDIIAVSPDEFFKAHINDERNDVAEWIEGTYKDHELAAKIRSINSKEQLLLLLEGKLKG